MLGPDDPAPRLPPTPGERWLTALVLLGILGLFVAEIVRNAGPRALAVAFMFAAWAPLLVVHELGHALAARLCGWRVEEIVIGFGRELFRFTAGDTHVRVKLIPVEGYVVPTPRRPGRARLKSAFIYFAGPGAELLVLLLLYLASGQRLFQRSDDIGLLAMQGAALAIGMGLFTNLLPWPRAGAVNDGMGILLSLRLSPAHFADRMLALPLARARRFLLREEFTAAAEVLAAARSQHPDDPRLLAWGAVVSYAQGEQREAENQLKALGEPDTHPPAVAAELLLARAFCWWSSGDIDVLPFARQACERALALTGRVPDLILAGHVELARGQAEAAYQQFMNAYKQAREADEETACLAGLVLATKALTARPRPADRQPVLTPGHLQRFARALEPNQLGPRLRARVEQALARPR